MAWLRRAAARRAERRCGRAHAFRKYVCKITSTATPCPRYHHCDTHLSITIFIICHVSFRLNACNCIHVPKFPRAYAVRPARCRPPQRASLSIPPQTTCPRCGFGRSQWRGYVNWSRPRYAPFVCMTEGFTTLLRHMFRMRQLDCDISGRGFIPAETLVKTGTAGKMALHK